MSGGYIDYGIERQRHENFVGRAGLLARLDQLLVTDPTDRWVVVSGGPGMGKSAVLSAWLVRREAAGVMVPHHFIRRGEYGWDDPATLVRSLVAQIEARFPDQREPAADARKHPVARLAATLARVSVNELLPRGERLVVLLDGLDEYDPPPASWPTGDPLAAFLPHALPPGVSFLCASRPRHPHLPMLEAREGEVVRIDLDDRNVAADNDATVRRFWEHAAPPLELDRRCIDQAVARASGNLQHAVTLRKHLAGLPAAQRRVESIPRGLAALLVALWQRIATDPIAVHGLGILCAAREALTLDELGTVASWTEEAQQQAFLRGAGELLVETRRADEQPEYRLHHEAIRAHIHSTLGAEVIRAHHAALARQLATWPAPVAAPARRYALRHALAHRAEAHDFTDAWRLAADMEFLEAKCRELGVHDAEADVARTGERCRGDDEVLFRRFDDLARALARESHWLREAPDATAALVWNRLRRSGWSAHDLDAQLSMPAQATFLRLRHVAVRESSALVRNLAGHTGWVNTCVVTPDGRRVISASKDRTLKVWDLATGRLLASLEDQTSWVTACTVTPDGQRVVSASDDHALKVWDLHTGRLLTTFPDHAGEVTSCVVTPDGHRVVCASGYRALDIWDLDTGQLVATFEGHTDMVTACAVTPDGQRVISASWDRTLQVWDLATGHLLATLEGHTATVTACAVTSDGRRVVSASEDHTLKVWDLDTGQLIATLEGHTDMVNGCAVTPDGQRVVSASADRTLKVWHLETGRPLATLEDHTRGVTACAITPDGRRVISASGDQTLKIWSLDTDSYLATHDEDHARAVTACAVTPDGRHAVTASDDHTLKVWDLEQGHLRTTFKGHALHVTMCAVTPDGRRVVSASLDHTLKVWDLATGHVADSFGDQEVSACAVTPDGRHVISASWELTLKFRELDTGRVLATFGAWPQGHADTVTACAVPPDGHRVVSASKDGTLKLWDLDEGRLLATFRGHTDGVTACAVTPDGQRVISASRDGTLKLWNLPSGRLLATFEGHTDAVTACAVLPDSRRVVSASRDGTLKLWSLDTQACLLTHRGDAPYTAVAATTAVIAGDDAGIVWVLDWPPSRDPAVRAAGWPSPPCALPAPVTATTRQRRQS